MKKFFLFLAVTFMSLMASAQTAEPGVILTLKDGTTVGFKFTEQPKMTFTATDLVVTTTKLTVNYAMDGLKMTFGQTTAVESVSVADAQFSITEGGVAAKGLKAGQTVAVYSINGSLVGKATASETGVASVNIPGKGVYVVKTGKISYKVTKF